MPYKDPEAQRTFQREWYAKRRKETLAAQKCGVCSGTVNLRLRRKNSHVPARARGMFSKTEKNREAILKGYNVICKDCLAKV